MRCFSSPRSPSYKRMLSLQLNGLPHSDIHGSMVICTSPQLFAAYHVLLRLREPRHPPFALAYFFFLDIINILAENVLINFSSSLLLLYNFFLIRHIYIIHAETKRLLSCDRKLFLLYVVNSRLKKFFCCLLQGIILSSQITYIYLTLYFSLVAICQWPLSSLRIPPDPTPLYPYESSLSQKLYPKSLKNQTPQKRLSRNRTAKVIPFYYTTKLFTNFFWEKRKVYR